MVRFFQTPRDTCFCLPIHIPNGQRQQQHFLQEFSVLYLVQPKATYVTEVAAAVSFANRAMPTSPPQQQWHFWSLTCHTSCRGTLPPEQLRLCCLSKGWFCVRCRHSALWRWEGAGEAGGWPGPAAEPSPPPRGLSWSGRSQAAHTIKVRHGRLTRTPRAIRT